MDSLLEKLNRYVSEIFQMNSDLFGGAGRKQQPVVIFVVPSGSDAESLPEGTAAYLGRNRLGADSQELLQSALTDGEMFAYTPGTKKFVPLKKPDPPTDDAGLPADMKPMLDPASIYLA